MESQGPSKPELDHALVYCSDCPENRLGIIRNGKRAECAVCHGYHTGPADNRRMFETIRRRGEAERRRNGKAVKRA